MQYLRWLGVEHIDVSLREKAIAALGAACAIYLLIVCVSQAVPATAAIGIVGSMGATAVLLFAVPHGPLSQPWPVFGGHLVSAVVGVTCAKLVDDPALSSSLAVGLSIGLMQQLKCIHPPGGATAFTAVIGGDSIRELGFQYVLYPVLLNALIMVALAILFNYPFGWRRYPSALIARPSNFEPHNDSLQLDHNDFVEAMKSLDSFVDVSEEDLNHLARMMTKRFSEKA